MATVVDSIINSNGTLVYIVRNWIESNIAIETFNALSTSIPWQQQEFVMYGKRVKEPRLTFVAGDAGLVHSYTNINRPVVDWSLPSSQGGCSDILGMDILKQINYNLPNVTNGNQFNAILLNFYRYSTDYISMHSDKETSPLQSTVVSVSLGSSRIFVFKRKTEPFDSIDTIINNGDLMVMAGECQKQWTHGIPKMDQKKYNNLNIGPRISVTYRLLHK